MKCGDGVVSYNGPAQDVGALCVAVLDSFRVVLAYELHSPKVVYCWEVVDFNSRGGHVFLLRDFPRL